MSPQDIRETLIARTISVIANDGLDKTTTKAITTGTGINEAYIYRYFAGKEDLLAKSFEKLDNELLETVMQELPVMSNSAYDFKTRGKMYFTAVWDFMLANKEHCIAYVRYFYSTYFTKYSADFHQQLFIPLVEKFSEAFIEEANVWMILNHILNVMLDFAVKVHNNQMPENDDYSEHVFRVIYESVRQYFKEGKESKITV